jgi:hypothetical protein
MTTPLVYEIVEIADDGKVNWWLYRGAKILYDGEVDTIEEAQEMLQAAKRLLNK